MQNNDMKIQFSDIAGSAVSVFDFDFKYRWKDDLQPGRLKGVPEYIRDAEALKPQLIEYVTDLVEKYAPGAILMIDKSVKEELSSLRKLTDEDIGGDPRKICDYLRAKIVIRASANPDTAIEQIVALRNHLMFDPETTAYFDKFRNPCPEGGHRAFLAHRHFSNEDGISQIAEIQIAHEAFEFGPYDEAVKNLRLAERAVGACIKSGKQMSAHFLGEAQTAYNFIQKARYSANTEAAEKYHLNDPRLTGKEEENPVYHNDNVVAFSRAARNSRPLHAVGHRLQTAVSFLGEKSQVATVLRRVLG